MGRKKVTQAGVLSALAMSFATGGRGMMRDDAGTKPAQRLRLYDMEGCPFCRVVRERLCELELDVEIYPCPKGGKRYRPIAEKLIGEKTTFPVLHDPNREVALNESADIVRYLNEHYGGGRSKGPGLMAKPSNIIASVFRPGAGTRAEASKEPQELLTLYSFEPSPFARLVRERLTELEIPYVVHQMPRDKWGDVGPSGNRLGGADWEPTPGSRRAEMVEKFGKAQVPFLIDPNTGTEMFESSKIVRYLEETYAA
jgi:glutathione S-transferase